MGRNVVPMTQDFLRSQLEYDSETGVFKWRPGRPLAKRAGVVAGSVNTTERYLQIFVGGKKYFAHRLAWLYVYGTWPSDMLDHINGDRQDNRIANLRNADSFINTQNVRVVRSSTGFMGVSRSKRRFTAMIRATGKTHYLGSFATAEQASTAYLKAKRELHKGCTL